MSTEPTSAAGATGMDEETGRRTLAKRAAAAVALSLVVNWLLLGAVLAGDLVVRFDPIAYPPVTIFTAVGAVGASAVYAALWRFVDEPDRPFTLVAAVVLLFSFVPDYLLLGSDPGATVPAVVFLAFLHVTTAVACVAALTWRLPGLDSTSG